MHYFTNAYIEYHQIHQYTQAILHVQFNAFCMCSFYGKLILCGAYLQLTMSAVMFYPTPLLLLWQLTKAEIRDHSLLPTLPIPAPLLRVHDWKKMSVFTHG